MWELQTPRVKEAAYGDAVAALEAAAPIMYSQALEDAVVAFPLETIAAPDNAVVWLRRRAEDLKGGINDV